MCIPLETGDKGQRYEVRCKNKCGEHVIVGWSETLEGAKSFAKGVRLHLCMHSPRILDRQESK